MRLIFQSLCFSLRLDIDFCDEMSLKVFSPRDAHREPFVLFLVLRSRNDALTTERYFEEFKVTNSLVSGFSFSFGSFTSFTSLVSFKELTLSFRSSLSPCSSSILQSLSLMMLTNFVLFCCETFSSRRRISTILFFSGDSFSVFWF